MRNIFSFFFGSQVVVRGDNKRDMEKNISRNYNGNSLNVRSAQTAILLYYYSKHTHRVRNTQNSSSHET